MTPSRPDPRRPRRTPSTPLSIAASVALSACLLGTTSVAAHAKGGADATTAAPAQDAPSVPALPAPTPSIAPDDAAPSVGPTAPEAAPAAASAAPAAASAAPSATPAVPDASPSAAPPAPTPETAPPAAALAPAPTAVDVTTPPSVAAAPEAPVPSLAPSAPDATPTPTLEAPAAASETPVAAAQQQPAPPPSAPMTGDSLVSATVRGTFELKPGEKPVVGTKVKWIITFRNNGTATADVYGTQLSIPAGQSRDGRDDVKEQTVTQADLDAGVMGYANTWGVVTPAGVHWIPVRGELPIPAENPALEVVFTPRFEPAPGQPVVLGTVVDSTVTVTNRGEVTLHDITFTGTTPFSLAPGQQAVLGVKDKVDQLDVNAGEYRRGEGYVTARTPRGAAYKTIAPVRLPFPKPNVAGATSTATPAPAPGAGAGGSPASGTADESWRFRGEFVLQPGEQVKAGTKVRWTSTLTNTGPDDLRDLVAVRVGAAPGSPGSTSEKLAVLAKGRTAQLHLESTVTEDDLASGLAHIVVDATAVTGGRTNTVRSGATLAIPAENPLLAVTATIVPRLAPGAAPVAGTVFDVTLTIVNRGDVTLTDVRIDKLVPFTLAPGESAVRVLTGEIEDWDVEAGEYRRSGNMTARTPRGVEYFSPDIVVVLPIPASTPSTPAPTGTPSTPAPTGTSATAVPTGTVPTSAPTGTPSTPAPVPPTSPAATGDHLVSATAKGTLELKPGEKPTVGTKVTWIVTFRNDGPVAVTVAGSGLVIPPGASRDGRDVTFSRTVTQADLDAGKVSYAFTWDLSSTQGRFALPVVGELALPGGPAAAAERPALEVAYAPSFRLAPGASVTLGTVVDATVTLTNRGDVALNDIRLAGLPPFSLAPGQVSVQRLSDTISLSDLTAGEYRRVGGFATARTPRGAEHRSTPATIVLAIPKPAPTGTTPGSAGGTTTTPTPTPTSTPTPTISSPAGTATPAPGTTGTAPGATAGGPAANGPSDAAWRFRGEFVLQPGEQVTAGTKVRWTSTVTNTGPGDVRDLVAVRVGAAPGSPGSTSEKAALVAPGGSAELHLESTVTEDDLASGLTHIVADTTTVIGGRPTTVRSGAQLAIPVERPLLAVTTTSTPRLAPGAAVAVGTIVDTTFTIVNRGDVALTDVRVDTLPPFTLAPGESAVRTLAGPVQQSDVEAGEYRRSGTITATTPRGAAYTSDLLVTAVPIPRGSTTGGPGSAPTPAPTVTPSTPAPTGTPSSPAPTGTPSTVAPTVTPSGPVPTGTPSTPTPTGTPSTPAPIGTPSAPAPTGTPSAPVPTGTPSAPVPTGTPSTPAPTATPSIPAPIGTPSTPAPTGTPTTPAPTNTPSIPAPIGTPSAPAPTGTPTTPAPTNTPSIPAPIGTPSAPPPTGTPTTPAPTDTPSTPAPTGSPATPAPTGTPGTGTGLPATGTAGAGATGTGTPATGTPGTAGTGTPSTGTTDAGRTGTRPSTAGPHTTDTGTTGTRPTVTGTTGAATPGAVGPGAVGPGAGTTTGTIASGTTSSGGAAAASAGTSDARTTASGTTASGTGTTTSGTGTTGTTPSGAGSGSPHSGVTGTRPTKDASATRLAETGVDAASALPAAGVLGLLGALGLLLGRRRRGNRAAD
ncbi:MULTISPECIES: LPXTG cell wall anchor domain-containing protein [unclassified Rathayibacter]|uniref:DUF7507 domain-containing protein n=1 Tax=unclassified Rathayibacter TaxID=2609250 RepID=UPI000FB69609|nr:MULTISPECIES: LPXTG cell wall anchor domain-containing protein [unclassified Rathayibacter]ROP49211.1 LPXTG-motif cell wall-anchored protein [Rathayibacter sp. PhB186]ROS50672.1 LPXTG-motif cell wall-anchored protein [Rathayibacter sp. PhB185]